MSMAHFEIVNTTISTPFPGASNFDMVLRTDNQNQKILIGNGSNVTPALTLSNNIVTAANTLYQTNPIMWYSKNTTTQNTAGLNRLAFTSVGPSIMTRYFNNSSNGFVCPLNGYYNATFSIHLWTNSGQITGGGFYRNNILYNSNVVHFLHGTNGGDAILTTSDIIPLQSNDILTVRLTLAAGINTGNIGRHNVFFGYLMFPT